MSTYLPTTFLSDYTNMAQNGYLSVLAFARFQEFRSRLRFRALFGKDSTTFSSIVHHFI